MLSANGNRRTTVSCFYSGFKPGYIASDYTRTLLKCFQIL